MVLQCGVDLTCADPCAMSIGLNIDGTVAHALSILTGTFDLSKNYIYLLYKHCERLYHSQF